MKLQNSGSRVLMVVYNCAALRLFKYVFCFEFLAKAINGLFLCRMSKLDIGYE